MTSVGVRPKTVLSFLQKTAYEDTRRTKTESTANSAASTQQLEKTLLFGRRYTLSRRMEILQDILDKAFELARYRCGKFMDDFAKPVGPGMLLPLSPPRFLTAYEQDRTCELIAALDRAEHEEGLKTLKELDLLIHKLGNNDDEAFCAFGHVVSEAILNGLWKTVPQLVEEVFHLNDPQLVMQKQCLEKNAAKGDFKAVYDLLKRDNFKDQIFTVVQAVPHNASPHGWTFAICERSVQTLAFKKMKETGKLEEGFFSLLENAFKSN